MSTRKITKSDSSYQFFVSYSELLLTNEWKQFSKLVLKAADYKCTSCKKSQTLNLADVSFKGVQIGSHLNGRPFDKLLETSEKRNFTSASYLL
jgi:hypothetical protein